MTDYLPTFLSSYFPCYNLFFVFTLVLILSNLKEIFYKKKILKIETCWFLPCFDYRLLNFEKMSNCNFGSEINWESISVAVLQVNLIDELEPLVVRGSEVGQKSHQAVLVNTDQGHSWDILTAQFHKIQNLPSSPSSNKEKSKSEYFQTYPCRAELPHETSGLHSWI